MYHRQLLSMRRTWTVLVSAFLLACGGGSESPAPSTSQTTASTTGSANGGAGGTTSTGGFGGSPQPCDDGADPAPPEALTDCNDNGVADDKEIADGGLDCNGNTVVDECEDVTGCTSWGRENYIEYKAGSLPIVLSAPHGGSLTPAELPELQGVSIGGDLKTIELAEAISDGLLSLAGRRPHLVFCHVYRKRLECNRDRVKGTEGNPFAEPGLH